MFCYFFCFFGVPFLSDKSLKILPPGGTTVDGKFFISSIFIFESEPSAMAKVRRGSVKRRLVIDEGEEESGIELKRAKVEMADQEEASPSKKMSTKNSSKKPASAVLDDAVSGFFQ